MHRGVYRVAGVAPTPELRRWAALLWAGDGAALSHLTAGWLWKLEGLGRLEPELIDVAVPAARVLVANSGVRVHRLRLAGKDLGRLAGFPILLGIEP